MDDDLKLLQRLADCGGMEMEFLELKRDAERYRWLRERETEVRRYTLVGQRASERLDDQIDAAIEESKAVGAV